MSTPLINILEKNKHQYYPVVPFDPEKDRLLKMDFTEANKALTKDVIEDVSKFSSYVDQQLSNAGARYGIGGYAEHRTVYSRSKVFDDIDGGEPRRLHLGVDIWGKAGTPVFAPLGGMVHSFKFNDRYGDYGATIILLHQLESAAFYTLWGHVSLKDIAIVEGQYINREQEFAHFGEPHENGHWPPHLHFQIIENIELHEGDYPGVCRMSDKNFYLKNCPDPDLILQMNRYL
ncbi:peptidoglycan DD-metalloendopeptidase family protein [Lacibacter sediminis]|uniref:Peptidoglycan DD-metalloendopeptidase family protein n=1 Tax=Lacibacter sediminis TaxID=2760713 RepID=A0A7G5XEV9_9BACT|nr:peptidoglycan DD-metalloendopeptidase family protein [Lacibacter sediminis]QNA44012.1 peptidoglycan DD-metalloendopeptidase family protein [Lacibacter sediminis]